MNTNEIMNIVGNKKKVGRPIGSLAKTKTVTFVIDKKTVDMLTTYQGYLSDKYKCQLTLNQTAEHILKTYLETT